MNNYKIEIIYLNFIIKIMLYLHRRNNEFRIFRKTKIIKNLYH